MNLVIRFRGENGKIVDSDVYTFEEAILRTFFEAEAETLIPPLVFASVMMLKPAFHRWRFKIVRTVEEDELTKLRKDFVDYFRKNTSMSAGAYTCKVGDRSTCVILKFDEVIYIGP